MSPPPSLPTLFVLALLSALLSAMVFAPSLGAQTASSVRGAVTPPPAGDPDLPPGYVQIGDMILQLDPDAESATANVNLWPHVIPYTFDGNVNGTNQNRMLAAMDELESFANVQFIPHTDEPSWIHVRNGASNSAFLGMGLGARNVTITSWTVHYTIVHELIHVLGFIHEHQRPDRDTFITINEGNALPAALPQLGITFSATAVGPYDLDSVMHYGQCQGTACGSCTPGCEVITVLPPNQAFQSLIGQRDHLSVEDVAGIVAVYGSWDCDNNLVHDYFDITSGTLDDCNGNGEPDMCEPPGTIPDCNNNGIGDPCEIASGAATDCNGNGIPDDCDVASGLLEDCNGNGIADLCELESALVDCNGNGILDECDISTGTSPDVDRNGIPDECDVPTIVHVDGDATGLANGSSWDDALPLLTDALALAAAAPNIVEEIWVAEGLQRPAPPGGPRSDSFALIPGIPVYGGFEGAETALSQRDPANHFTVLSADLLGDDLPGFVNRTDNSHHVVTAPFSFSGELSVLDGFLVEGGEGFGSGIGVRFGGGLRAIGPVALTHCRFHHNRAELEGGAVHTNSPLSVIDCTFVGNEAGRGGGLFTQLGAASVTNSIFLGNHATTTLGGAWGGLSTPATLTGTTLVGNTAATSGGGIGFTNGVLDATNIILWDNTDGSGRGESAQVDLGSGTLNIDYSAVQGLTGALGGTGNIFTPNNGGLFVYGRGPDGIPGSGDEDLRPAIGSPVIDAGNNFATPTGITTDISGAVRFQDDPATPDTGLTGGPPVVDMGAWEYRCWADFDDDGDVDADDITGLIGNDGIAPGPGSNPADITGNGTVDANDVALALRIVTWGDCP